MSAEPSYFPALSVHLSHVLDEVGVNELTVQRRRDRVLRNEHLDTLAYCVAPSFESKNHTTLSIYRFGSQSEGTTSPGLNSDADILCCLNYVNVIQDWAELEQGKTNLLMLLDGTYPGYCRLQLICTGEPLQVGYLSNEHFIYDRCNRVIVKNTIVHNATLDSENVQHGPAGTYIDEKFKTEYDNVNAYRCRTWPPQTYRFTRRYRHWPSKDLIKQSMTDGVFLVPVGCKLSPTESLEWRFSFSLTERRLMFSLNMTQIKCYVVLKMLLKTFITPYVGDSISSYHCKTALFYCIDELGYEYWQEENLVQGIMKCVNVLLTWVRDEFCPHFILPESNLFIGKITKHNKQKLQSILTDILTSNGRFLLCVHTDDLKQKLQMQLTTLPRSVRVLDSPQSVYVGTRVELTRIFDTGHVQCSTLDQTTSLDIIPLIQHVHQVICFHCSQMSQSDRNRKQTIQTFISFLSLWLGSLMTSVSLSRKQEIPKEAVKWLSLGVKHDISSMLKLASIFYCSGDLPKTETLLHYVSDRYRRYNIRTLCTCCSQSCGVDDTTEKQLFAAEYTVTALFDDCVKFSPHEHYCVPPALRLEFNRSTGDDIVTRSCVTDNWMNLAVVDSRPYLCYLQYITYGQMGKRDLQKQALDSLEICLVEHRSYGHLETGWNLLGQCMEQEENLKAAMRCYRTSLEIRPQNNTANWHVQNLDKT